MTLTAARDGDGYRVSGDAPLVLDGHCVDVLLVAANTPAGTSLLAVAADSDGVEREPLASLDRTRKVARIRFDGAPGRLIGTDGDAATGLARTSDLAVVALAAEQLGAAQRCLDMAVGYAKDRIQFGRAIGSFQAIKHRCADMLVSVEGARSAVVHAAEAADGPDLATAACGRQNGLLGSISAGGAWTTCAFTAASASHGSTTRTYTSGEPKQPS